MMVGYHYEGPEPHRPQTTSIIAKTSNKLLEAPAALRTGWALLLIVTLLGFMGNSAVRNLEADASVETKGTNQQQKHLGGRSPPKDVNELKAALSALERDEESLQEQLAQYVETNDSDGIVRESKSSTARNNDADEDDNFRTETFVIPEELSLAHEQSSGFFDDIPNETWQLMRQRVAERRNHESVDNPMLFSEEPKIWYQMNWQPDFSCLLEQKVGFGVQSESDGSSSAGRWVCNPHRIVPTSSERRRAGGNGCLVYSFVGGGGGGDGDGGDFVFEKALLETLGGGAEGGAGGAPCEVHVFDPRKYSGPISVPDGVLYHPWGLIGRVGGGDGSDATADATGANDSSLESFRDIVNDLGHRGHSIDVLRVDCNNGCEWTAYRDWLSEGGVDVRQILVRTHGVPENANEFFEAIQREGYVVFHKEPDTWASEGANVDYAFLKLDKSFFVAN